MVNRLQKYIPRLVLLLVLSGCQQAVHPQPGATVIPRDNALPAGAVKIDPEDDPYPPRLHHPGWEDPEPLPGPINTAGGEDAPFIPTDGGSIFFFFTPDVSLPAGDQLLDGATGIYQAPKTENGWGQPRRVVLSDDPALDGCPFALRDRLWFCSARAGTEGVNWYTAELLDGTWQNWQPASFDPDLQVGEFHISADGSELYYGSDRPGTAGGSDLWVSRWEGDQWSQPGHLSALNTPAEESRPFTTRDGKELWFTRTYRGSPAVFRSRREDGAWGKPELIVSQFAGEPTLDPEGNLYFVHHFYLDGQMVEVDIYWARRKN